MAHYVETGVSFLSRQKRRHGIGRRKDRLVPIGEAARTLGVSIATVRRWEKKGILRADRYGGRYRYFSVDQLKKVKYSRSLTVSQAAQQLGISPSTLRRLEERGVIKPERNEHRGRQYTQAILNQYLNSEYARRQMWLPEDVLAQRVSSLAKKTWYIPFIVMAFSFIVAVVMILLVVI